MADLDRARQILWEYVGAPTRIQPSIDAITLAFAELAEQFALSRQALEILSERLEVLEARERLEHQPVSGWVTFGRPVRGVVSFTATPPH